MGTCHLNLPNGRSIVFDYPERFHLPRYLAGRGLQNYEPLSQALFLASVERMNGVVFDIGANIGVYAMMAATTLRRPVYAYEPFAEAAAVLSDIATRYAFPIHVIEAAVSDSLDDKTFYVSVKSDMSNSLNPNFRQHAAVRTVRSVTIDSEANRVRPCAIKIDTETTEMDVLRGAQDTMRRDRPVMLVEILGADIAKAARDFLHTFHYEIIEIGSPDVIARFGDVSDVDISGDMRNWLAVPAELPATDEFYGSAIGWLNVLRGLPIA